MKHEQMHIVFIRRHYRDGVYRFLFRARNDHKHVDTRYDIAEECKVVHWAERIGII
jgi:hypothetical protein